MLRGLRQTSLPRSHRLWTRHCSSPSRTTSRARSWSLTVTLSARSTSCVPRSTIWQELSAPYESAHERALIAMACRQLGDEESARLEFEQARTTFETLGAAPDVAAIDALVDATADTMPLPGGLTAREAEVLKLVTAGMSNHEIAVQLVVSDHTVRRHLQNIFAKAGVSSRAAATVYVFEHGLN